MLLWSVWMLAEAACVGVCLLVVCCRGCGCLPVVADAGCDVHGRRPKPRGVDASVLAVVGGDAVIVVGLLLSLARVGRNRVRQRSVRYVGDLVRVALWLCCRDAVPAVCR